MAAGLTSACEVGPGKTLTGFAGKISKELTCKTVQDMAACRLQPNDFRLKTHKDSKKAPFYGAFYFVIPENPNAPAGF